MAKLSLRNPETQAKLSVVLTVAGAVVVLGALAVGLGAYDAAPRRFIYSKDTLRAPIVYGAGALGLALACMAFWFAYHSAGERRNPRSGLSWVCFVVSAALIVIDCVFLAAFVFLASPVGP